MTFDRLILAPVAVAIMAAPTAAAAPVLLNGFKAVDVRAGTGIEARKGQAVTVHYTGWLYQDGKRGKKFDSSLDRGDPFTFLLGGGEVIRGWDDGLVGMKVGGKRTLILAPEAGYGDQGDETIPANSWLIFDIELLRVE